MLTGLSQPKCEVKELKPWVKYHFRVHAVNGAGAGEGLQTEGPVRTKMAKGWYL